jgi:hypothetical protein
MFRIQNPLLAFVLICLLSALSLALEVSPDSVCGPKCIDNPRTGNVSWSNSSVTMAGDIPCYDWEIVGNAATQIGQKFKDCNSCLKDTGYQYEWASERDTNWFKRK